MKTILLMILAACLLAGPSIGSAETSGDDAIAAVEQLEHERQHAMVAVDIEKLSRIIADDILYVHSTGLLQSRDDLFGMLVKGDIRYVAFNIENIAYRTYGSTVVGTGLQTIELTNAGKPFTSRSRYTIVYAVVDRAHRLVSYQSTAMPEIVLQETPGSRKSP